MAPDEETSSGTSDLLLDGDPIARGPRQDKAPLTEEQRKKRRRKIALLIAILVGLAIILYMLLRSLGGSSPLPGIPTDLPHHVADIYGTEQPMGVAVSPSGGRIYVTESEGKRLVRVYNSSGDQVGTLKPPGKNGAWRLPVYVAVNPDTEDVYVSDRLREEVEVYNADGKYLRAWKPKGKLGKHAEPLGLAFGSEGDLYMTNVAGSKKTQDVLVFRNDKTTPIRRIGRPGNFWFPNGIAVSGDGNVYVADSNDGQVLIYDKSGKLVSSVARGVGEGDLGLPRGIALYDNRLFVVDTTAHTIKVYDLPGNVAEVPRFVGSFGVEGIGSGQFQYPNGIAAGGDGRIYVTDRENNRVQVWSY